MTLALPRRSAWTPFTRPHVEEAHNENSALSLVVGDQVAWLAIGALTIEVRPENDQYIALEHETGMFGEGDDVEEAMIDLLTSLHEHRDDLLAHEPRLSRHLQHQLEALTRSLPG